MHRETPIKQITKRKLLGYWSCHEKKQHILSEQNEKYQNECLIIKSNDEGTLELEQTEYNITDDDKNCLYPKICSTMYCISVKRKENSTPLSLKLKTYCYIHIDNACKHT